MSLSWYLLSRLNDWLAMLASGRPTLVVYNAGSAGATSDFVTADFISTRPPNTLHLSVILPETWRPPPRIWWAAPAVTQGWLPPIETLYGQDAVWVATEVTLVDS